MEWLTLIFISPLELLYRGLFEVIQIFVKNLGVALLVLSFVTVALMIPLERAVRPIVQREKEIEAILAPQIKSIKEKFTGASEHAALKRLYARYRYSPVFSVYSALGVLIQLPFLLGAYWMLSDYEAIAGVAFGPIADLSKPDALLFGINVLPILMTAINLATIRVARFEGREAIQATVVAALFLILLYEAPSALLVYWTMNNVLHCLRALGKHIPIKEDALKAPLKFIGAFLEKNTVTLIVFFFVGVFAIASVDAFPYLKSLGKAFWIYVLLWGALTLAALFYAYKRGFSRRKNFGLRDAVLAVIVLSVGVFLAKEFFFLVEKLWQPSRRFQLEALCALILPILALLSGLFSSLWPRFYKKLQEERSAILVAGFVCGLLLLTVTILWFPLSTYASDPKFFSNVLPVSLALERVAILLVSILAFSFVWLLLKPIRLGFSLLILFLGVSSLTFAFLVRPDYGIIDTFLLQHESALSNNFNRITDVLVYLLTPLLLSACILFRKINLLKNIFAVGLAVVLVASGGKVFTAKEFLKEKASPVPVAETKQKDEIPEYVKEFHTFSKNGKNVVVIFLDMFTGGNMKEILEETPELKTELDGFTLYKDVVTAGICTIFGKPSILGGEAAAPWNLNKDKTLSLEEKINRSWATFFNKLVDENYRIRVSESIWLVPSLMKSYVKSPEKHLFCPMPLWRGSASYWQKREGGNFDDFFDVNYERFWLAIGLFNVAPLSQRVRVYSESTWMGAVNPQNASIEHARIWFSDLDTHADLSSVSWDTDNRFLFVSSLITHVPWALDGECKPCKNGAWDDSKDLKNKGLSREHLQVERCALLSVVRWLHWMKENGVYDNTQVIVISDHGRGDSSEIVEKNGGNFYPLCPHGLLLVKNFGTRGEMQTDATSRMINGDLPEIVLRNVKGQELDGAPWTNSKRVRFHVDGHWQRSHHPKNYFSDVTLWKIPGSVYDVKSWKKEGKLP